MNFNDISNQVLEQADIVDVVSEFVPLVPKGKNFFGLCPFHDDKHPSMSVSRERRMFNCFSCGEKGNAIAFYAKCKNLTYGQATVQLAKKLGIQVDENFTRVSDNQARLYKIMSEALNFYRFYLNNSVESAAAYEYLNERFISKEIIDEFEIGLAPSAENNLNLALKSQNIMDLDQIELGLVNENQKGIYDIFRQRIMFPIYNHSGNVVGFSGRIYQKSSKEQAKYVNSKETSIFHKGNILYNFFKASKVARSLDCFYLFEGFMDVIAAYKADIKNGIATMGTALTAEHVKSILAITNNIVLCFDGDAAGIKALTRSISIFSDFNIVPKAIILPNDLDPDEYFNKYGKEALNKELVEGPKNAYDVLYEHYLQMLNRNDVNSLENFKKLNFEFMTTIHQETSIDFYLKKIANELNVALPIIVDDFRKFKLTLPTKRYDNTAYGENKQESQIIEPSITPIKLTKKNSVLKKHIEAFKEIIGYIMQSSIYKKQYEDKMGVYADYSGFKELMSYHGIIRELSEYYAKVGISSEDTHKRIDLHTLDRIFPDHNSKEYLICYDIMTSEKFNVERTEKCFNDNIDCLKQLIKGEKLQNSYEEALNLPNKDEGLKKFYDAKRKNINIKKG